MLVLGSSKFHQARNVIVAGNAPGMITNVTGTVSNGNVLTITGTNLVQENTTDWDPYFTSTHPNASGFEGASFAADGYDITGSSSPVPTYTSATKLMGSQCCHIQDGSALIEYGTGAAHGDPGWGDFYLAQYSKWNISTWPNEYWKYWWMAQGGLGTWSAFFQLDMTGSLPTQSHLEGTAYDGSGATVLRSNLPFALTQNVWHLFEFHGTCLGGGATPVMEAWMNNALIFSVSAASGIGPRTTWETNVNSGSTAGGPTGDLWHDRFVSSHSRVGPAALIEIGNGSNVYASANRLWQSPEFLSDTSCQNVVSLPAGGAPYWLWVTNNSGVRSQAWAL